MLVNDLDWLRDSLLLWHRTIVNANKTEHISEATYGVMPQVVEEYHHEILAVQQTLLLIDEESCVTTDEEMKLILPVFQLNQSVLSS